MDINRERLYGQLDLSLTNHTPDVTTIHRIESLRGFAKDYGGYVIEHAPVSRELSLALTHLEESVMWAVKAMVLPRDGGR